MCVSWRGYDLGMMRWIAGLAVSAGLCVVSAGPARGEGTSATPFLGPVLAGGRVWWGEQGASDSGFSLYTARARSGHRSLLATFPAVGGENLPSELRRDFPRLAAGDGMWIVGRTASANLEPVCLECRGAASPPLRPRPLLSEALAGRVGGSMVVLVGCRRPTAYGAPAVAANRGLIAYSRGGCRRHRRDQIIVRKGLRGRILARFNEPPGARVTGLALGGRWLAWTLQPPGKASELFLATMPAGRPLLVAKEVAERVSVTADGTVGFVIAPSSSCPQATWASAAALASHLLPGCVSVPADNTAVTGGGPQVKLANGHAAYVQRTSATEDRLVVSDLAGTRQHAVAAFAAATEQIGDIDFDKPFVVWSTKGCQSGTIHAASPDGAFTPATNGPVECPVQLPRAARADAQGRFSVLASCPRGCLGELDWYDMRSIADATAKPDATPLSLPPRHAIRLRVRLVPALRRRLVAHGVVRVWLVAQTNDSGGGAGPQSINGTTLVPRSILVHR